MNRAIRQIVSSIAVPQVAKRYTHRLPRRPQKLACLSTAEPQTCVTSRRSDTLSRRDAHSSYLVPSPVSLTEHSFR